MSSCQEVCILYLKVSKCRHELFEHRHSRSELAERLELSLEASKWFARESSVFTQCREVNELLNIYFLL